MQSTPFTPNGVGDASATEDLASRYRHLFLLPSVRLLLILSGVVSVGLTLASGAGVWTIIPELVVFFASALVVSSSLRLSDRITIASFRRVNAVLVAGSMLWLICLGGGLAATAMGVQRGLANSFLFGALACAGLEFVIIDGAFSRNVLLSFFLAAVYPFSTLLVVYMASIPTWPDATSLVAGIGAFVVVAAFPILLRGKKTSKGHDALQLFKAFMKTWVAGASGDLEAIIVDHAEDATVTTKLLRFASPAGSYFIILPGVHPGPFHPIGSYDLPGEISRAFKQIGTTMTLHRPGGHERNLATRELTKTFAEEVARFGSGIKASDKIGVRGPVFAKVGKASASATAFAGDTVLTISFSPLGSDDMDVQSEVVISGLGTKAGLDTSVVDAHNSIDHNQESPELGDPGWEGLLRSLAQASPEGFKVGYAHSDELDFHGGRDLTENGVGLMLFVVGARKLALVLADANNAVPPLRAKVSEALESAGFGLIELCTSDSHNLAARGLTVERGYLALGEDTSVESLAELMVRMAKLAETKVGPATYGSGRLTSQVKVFGAKALEEFATLTRSSSKLGKDYLRMAVLAVGGLLLVSLAF